MKTVKSYQYHNHHLLSQRSLKQLMVIIFLLTLTGMLLTNCTPTEPSINTTEPTAYEGKKIMWIDSYHAGYEWSDGIETGLNDVLDGTGVELMVFHMDTKRNTSEAFGEEAALKAKAEIEAFAPDMIIACDDNAQKYLVVPYLKATNIPIVFCGVNWDASIYGYPTDNITGMVEVDSITQMVDLLEVFAEGNEIAFLTENTETERKVFEAHNTRFFNNQLNGVFINNFNEFKTEYLRLQDEVDMLYIGNNASLTDWDDAAAQAFVLENAKIPTGSIYDWMAPYALLVVGKSGNEQGKWSAETALSIFDGTPVSEIPLVENKESSLILNLNLAEKLNIVFTPSMLRNAEFYGE